MSNVVSNPKIQHYATTMLTYPPDPTFGDWFHPLLRGGARSTARLPLVWMILVASKDRMTSSGTSVSRPHVGKNPGLYIRPGDCGVDDRPESLIGFLVVFSICGSLMRGDFTRGLTCWWLGFSLPVALRLFVPAETAPSTSDFPFRGAADLAALRSR